MNSLYEQVFRLSQFKKDFALDAILVPSKWRRYLFYAIVLIASLTMSIGVIKQWYELAWLSSAFIILVLCHYLIRAYRHTQSRKDEQQ